MEGEGEEGRGHSYGQLDGHMHLQPTHNLCTGFFLKRLQIALFASQQQWHAMASSASSSSTDAAIMVFVEVQPEVCTATYFTADVADALMSCQT